MNRSFRLVWNATQGLWVVASELAKGKSKAKNHSSVCKLKSTFAKGLFSAGVGFISLPVVAIDLTWVGGENGAWDELSSWDTGSLPTEYDDVEINSGTATITSEAEANSISVATDTGSSGNMIVEGSVSSISTGTMYVGRYGEGSLEATNGAELEVGTLNIGFGSTSTGDVSVSGSDTIVSAESISIGSYGEGALSVTDGAVVEVNAQLSIGYRSGGFGSMLISGGGSTVSAEIIIMGLSSGSEGELSVTGGAELAADEIYIGQAGSAIGQAGSAIVSVSGDSSSLNISKIILGNSGDGTLQVSDGSSIVTDLIAIGYRDDSVGIMNVSGSGTTVNVDGNIAVGEYGEGLLSVSDEASVVVDTLYIGKYSDSVGTVNIGAAEGETAVDSGSMLANTIKFGTGTGDLVFNHTDTDYELTADLDDYYGNGRVSLLSGTTSFTGDLTDYSGIMTVDGGTLRIASGKTLELGGSYTQTSSGVLKVGASSNSNYGKLVVAGTATFTANSVIAVDVASANSLAVDGTLSSVVSADTLEASTFSVTDNSALFDFSAVVNDDTVDLVIVQGTTDSTDSTDSSNVTSVTRYVTEQGHASSMGAAAMLDTFVSGGTTGTDMDNVVTALGQLSTGVEVSNAVAQTLPLLQGATNQVSASVTQTTSRVIQTRQAVTSGTSSGDGFITDKQGWVKVIGSSAKQDELNGSSGFESKSYGVIGGIDGEMNANSSMGIALSYVDSSIESTSTSSYNSAEIDSYQVAFYGQYALGANYHNVDVSWQADLGLNQTEGFRDITFMNREADSSYDSYAGHVGAGVGRIFSVAASTALVPSLRADYYYVHNESYTESGAGALNLEVESSNAEDFILTLQGDLQHEMNDQLFISASLGIGYDMMNDAASLTASYVGGGTTFTTAGLEQSPWIVTTGLAMNYSVNDTTQITASYDVQGREGFLNQTASAKVKWLF